MSETRLVQSWTAAEAVRSRRRIHEAHAACDAMLHRLGCWFTERRADRRFRRFEAHFAFLEPTLAGVVGRLRSEIDGADTSDVGATYDRCREVARGLVVVGRLFSWYAEKYDQRRDGRLAVVLSAADELVRSCWVEPFRKTGVRRPTGPLVFVAPRFGACATVREAVPTALKAGTRGVLGELVSMLPVPTIAMPEMVADEGWWLALGAHEVGHHVENDLAPRVGESLTGYWASWSSELFADLFAVLAVGEAAAWAVHELEFTRPATFFTPPRPGTPYPPPAVRLAFLGEAVRRLGVGTWPPAADEIGDWLASAAADDATIAAEPVAQALDGAGDAVEALLGSQVAGTPVRHLLSNRTAWFAAGGRVSEWTADLGRPGDTLYPAGLDESARLMVLAGVRAYRSAPERPVQLHDRLVRAVASAGPDGSLAVGDAWDDTPEEAARRLSAHVLQHVREAL